MTAPIWRPLPAWPHPAQPQRTSGFRTAWDRTLDQLQDEIERLRGTDPVFGIVIPEALVSWTGALRAGWSKHVAHRGVELSFEVPDGRRLVFQTSAFATVQENTHGILLGLEALRGLERWGIGQGNEQYAGFAALPADVAVERGRRLVAAAGGDVRAALKAHHPDVGGKAADAAAINAYAAVVKEGGR